MIYIDKEEVWSFIIIVKKYFYFIKKYFKGFLLILNGDL